MTAAFFEASPGVPAEQHGAISQTLTVMLAEARQAWPSVELSDRVYFGHLAGCMDSDGSVLMQLQRIAGSDLYLACACAQGDSHAIDTLESSFSRQIQMALGRIRNRSMLPDDFRQLLRVRLFVGGPDKGPAIGRYSGQGTLGAWVRVTAMRAALNATRVMGPIETGPPTEADLFDFETTPDDPEIEHLKRTYRAAFRSAFLDTVATIPGRDKTLLRQSVIHGLSVREISTMHGVHHATVARWIANVRAVLLDGTRKVLSQRLRVSARELDSIMGLIESRLEVSIVRALGSD